MHNMDIKIKNQTYYILLLLHTYRQRVTLGATPLSHPHVYLYVAVMDFFFFFLNALIPFVPNRRAGRSASLAPSSAGLLFS